MLVCHLNCCSFTCLLWNLFISVLLVTPDVCGRKKDLKKMCTLKYVAQKECALSIALQNHGSLTWLCLFPPIFPRCHTNPDPAADGGRQGVTLNRSETGLIAAIERDRTLRFLKVNLKKKSLTLLISL